MRARGPGLRDEREKRCIASLEFFGILWGVNKVGILKAIMDELQAEFETLRRRRRKPVPPVTTRRARPKASTTRAPPKTTTFADGLARQAHAALQAGAGYEDFVPPVFGSRHSNRRRGAGSARVPG